MFGTMGKLGRAWHRCMASVHGMCTIGGVLEMTTYNRQTARQRGWEGGGVVYDYSFVESAPPSALATTT